LKQFNLVDVVIILGFALFSIIYFLGRWKGAYPFVFLGGDAANIATFAAGWAHPDVFQSDAVLSNQANFRFYATLHIPLIQTLGRITGDYGSAFISLLSPHIFLQALGFYILGRVVFQSRYWAALLAIATLMPIFINLGEYWGIYIDPQPRFSFQALLPYLLAATFYWGHNPSSWAWLMAGAGILIYIHPVSAPTWGLAFWLGLWAFKPASFSFKKQLGYMLFAGAVFLAVTSPWIIHYLSNHAHGATADYREIYTIMTTHFGGSYFDIPTAVKEFILIVWSKRILPLAMVGAAIVLSLRRKNYSSVLLVGLWLGGLLIAAVVIPLIEQAIARAYNLIPLELDLIRGIRYIIPILLLFCLWPLVEIGKKIKAERLMAAIGALFVTIWVYQHPPTLAIEALACWKRGEFVCMPAEYSATIKGLEAIKQTPPNSRILPLGQIPQHYSLAIRYYALRPVVYSYKDGNVFGYANHAGFLRWYHQLKEVKAVEAYPNTSDKPRQIVNLSKQLGAQYCLTEPSINSTLNSSLKQVDIAFSNPVFTLLRISPK